MREEYNREEFIMIKKLFILFLICCLNLTACSGQQKTGSDATTISMPESTTAIMESKEDSQSYPDVEAGIHKINKYGNITLTIGPESMEKLGYEPADLIKVKIGDAEMEMPIGRLILKRIPESLSAAIRLLRRVLNALYLQSIQGIWLRRWV